MKALTYLMIFTFLFFSCNDEIDPFAGAPSSVEYLDISDGQYLALNEKDYQLYKFTKDEKQELFAQRVQFLDENKEPIDSLFTDIYIESIKHISPEYLCMYGGFTIALDTSNYLFYNSILVNKSDGRIYDMSENFPDTYSSYYLGSESLQKDNEGNRFFTNALFLNDASLKKLSGLNDGQLSLETYVSSSQILGPDGIRGEFYISPESNCFYWNNSGMKIKTASNGIIVVNETFEEIFSFNNKTYAFHHQYFDDPALNDVYNLVEVIVRGDTYELKEIAKLDYMFNREYAYSYENEGYGYLLRSYLDNIISVGIVFDGTFDRIRQIVLPENISNDLVKVEHFNDGFVWIGNENAVSKSMYKFDLSKFSEEQRTYSDPESVTIDVAVLNSYEAVQFPANIEIYEYDFISSGEISFTGFDLTSEEDITGVMGLDGNMTVLERKSDYRFTYLQRIN
ncbi:MAG: hypothetical protein R8N23_08180 [Reichenbachiella sp.]|uniref:hypothetical protein n=1 Tax=Reichenbachiella sp. TaxID=2184521 RepID=UPI002967357E|nr:hypothetical protein [Reichenbachiella sp.]MDW3209830.1 hypothetical protein [Reichenbachiella sp.]